MTERLRHPSDVMRLAAGTGVGADGVAEGENSFTESGFCAALNSGATGCRRQRPWRL